MVIGSGLIASAFVKDYGNDDKYLIFAAGVSNSFETNDNEFEKEKKLLIDMLLKNKDKHFVYFSSFIDSNYQKRKYATHKLNMESIIKESNNIYTILKLPQAIGNGGNKNSLINFIVSELKQDTEINVYKNTYKSLIDVEDIKRIVDLLVKQWHDKNTYVQIPYFEKLEVVDIVNLVAKQLKINPKIKLIDSELNDLPDLLPINEIIMHHLNIIPKGYTERTINKYVK